MSSSSKSAKTLGQLAVLKMCGQLFILFGFGRVVLSSPLKLFKMLLMCCLCRFFVFVNSLICDKIFFSFWRVAFLLLNEWMVYGDLCVARKVGGCLRQQSCRECFPRRCCWCYPGSRTGVAEFLSLARVVFLDFLVTPVDCVGSVTLVSSEHGPVSTVVSGRGVSRSRIVVLRAWERRVHVSCAIPSW